MTISGICPYTFPEQYSSIVLGGVRSPGVVTLSGHDRVENWDVQKAKGTTGATSQLNGADLGEFTATFYLAADSDDDTGSNDFLKWEAFQILIDSTTNGPKPVALPVYHPDLARNRFTEVVKHSVSGFVWDERGGATVVVKFGEHRPPKPKAAAKAKAKPKSNDNNGTGTRDPNFERKAAVAALRAEAAKP